MTPMRRDGSFTIYQVQFLGENEHPIFPTQGGAKTWYQVGGYHIANIPEEFRWDRKTNLYPKEKEPFASAGAGGECWQTTGVDGHLNFDDALEMMNLVAKYNPGVKFQIIMVKVIQESKVIANMMHHDDEERAL